MDLQAIGSASIAMSSAKLQQEVSVSVTKKAMDLQTTSAQALIQQLQAANPPSFGHRLDTYA